MLSKTDTLIATLARWGGQPRRQEADAPIDLAEAAFAVDVVAVLWPIAVPGRTGQMSTPMTTGDDMFDSIRDFMAASPAQRC